MNLEVNQSPPKKNKFVDLLIEIWEKIKSFFKCAPHKKIANNNSNGKNLMTNEKEEGNNYIKFNDYNNNHYYYDNINDYRVQDQAQMQASKQKLKQLESQTYSNRTMARLISTAELYALSIKCNNDQLYKKFDEFDNINRKTEKELKGELILQIGCFKVSYQSYVKKYKQYDFPDDYDEEATLNELKEIEGKINESDKKYYQAIIKLLQGDTNIPSFDEDLDELEDDEENSGTKDPKLQLETDIPIMRYLDGIRKNLKNRYLDDPMNCKVKLNLDEPFEKNEELEKLVHKLDSNKEGKKEKKHKKHESQKMCRSLSIPKLQKKCFENDSEQNHSRRNSFGNLPMKIKFNDCEDENEKEEEDCCDKDCNSCSDFEEDYK